MGKETGYRDEELADLTQEGTTAGKFGQEKVATSERERELEEVKVAFSGWKEALDERDRQHTSGTILQRALAQRLVKQRQRKYRELKSAFDTKYNENE